MGSGVARQCSRNRCLARWIIPIPRRGRGGAAGRANSKKDLVTGPIRGFCAPQARAEGQERLAEHIRIWRPKAIVVVMVAIAENVARAAREAGLEDVQEHVLPFPGRKAHRDRYVAELTSLVAGFEAAAVLLSGGRQRSRPAE
jgi:hypothetical protein